MERKNFATLLTDELNRHVADGGDLSHSSTGSAVLDLFAQGGAVRTLSKDVISKKILDAVLENPDLAVRTVLYLSDIRKGQGERDFFKLALSVLSKNVDKNTVCRLFDNVPMFGRWDYLFDFIDDEKYGTYVWGIIENEFKKNQPSLLYKWLPSIRRNSDRHLAIKFAKKLNLTHKEYRTIRTAMLKKLTIVEQKMSAKMWEDIDYSKVPSKASLIYKDAFKRHDGVRYSSFIESVMNGEKTIHASTLYPHEIVFRALSSDSNTVDALWKSLPDYINDKNKKILAMADVSGSMYTSISRSSSVRAIDVSIGLSMYLAERLTGEFKDTFMTFSSRPELVKLRGKTLRERVKNVERANWQMSTDIVAAFEKILDVAVRHNVPQEDLPTTLVIFSDMKFNSSWTRYGMGNDTPFEHVSKLFKSKGYTLPNVVYWNLLATSDNHPVTKDVSGTVLVSGYSPVTLQYVLNDTLKTPYELMLEVVMNERYNIWK